MYTTEIPRPKRFDPKRFKIITNKVTVFVSFEGFRNIIIRLHLLVCSETRDVYSFITSFILTIKCTYIKIREKINIASPSAKWKFIVKSPEFLPC